MYKSMRARPSRSPQDTGDQSSHTEQSLWLANPVQVRVCVWGWGDMGNGAYVRKVTWYKHACVAASVTRMLWVLGVVNVEWGPCR